MSLALVPLLVSQVVLWHSYRGGEQRALEEAVTVWNTAHPEAPVTPIAIPNEGFAQKLQAAIPRGHGPDLYIAGHEVVGEYARQGLVTPLDDAAIDPHAFLDATVAPLRLDGKLYGVPLAFKSIALFYRTDAVAAPPDTTNALAQLCRARAAKFAGTGGSSDPGRTCLAYEAGSFYYHAAWLHGFGGKIFDREGHDGRPSLATPEGVAAMRFVRSLVDRHIIPDETTGTVVTELFNDGRAVLAINGPWFVGEIQPGVKFGVAPLPLVSETGHRAAPLLTVEAGLISPQAKQPRAALAFLGWLAGPEGAAIRARVGRQTVSAAATWRDPQVANDPIMSAFRAQLDATVPMSNSPRMSLAWEPAQLALRKVLRGAVEPESALKEADARITLALRPAPPEAPRRPYQIALGLLLVAGALLLVQRSKKILQRNTRGSSYAYAYLGPAALAMAVLVFVPFAVGAAMSLYHSDGVSWRFIGLGNFTGILGSKDQPLTDPLSFYFTLVVTALWTLANVTLHVVLGVGLALALRDPLLRLRGIYRVLLIIPWTIPNYITALIWKGMFHRQLGAINGLVAAFGLEPVSWFGQFWTAFTANLTTNVWLGFPFMMVTTLGCLSRIPKELEEAAALDGAGRWERLRHIILPLLKPALLPSVILGAVWTFNMFNVVFIVSGGEPDGATDILITQAYRFAFARGHQLGYAAAYAVLIFLVLVIQSAILRRASPPSLEEA